MMKVLCHFVKNVKFRLFATDHGKSFIDEIGGEAKSFVCQQIQSKVENVIIKNASNFAEVCQTNLHRVTTHPMTKEQLQKLENFDLWSVSPEVQGNIY